jgi:hypothetical protein
MPKQRHPLLGLCVVLLQPNTQFGFPPETAFQEVTGSAPAANDLLCNRIDRKCV